MMEEPLSIYIFFDKRPWYISEKGDIIEYRRLQAMYLSTTGDVLGAYRVVESIPKNWFYEDELSHFTIVKAMLLWNMGDFHTKKEALEDEKFNLKPEKIHVEIICSRLWWRF